MFVHTHDISCNIRFLTLVTALLQENARLRSAGEGGEELLSGALQQLLGQKSELQQEVARLRSQNAALQVGLGCALALAAYWYVVRCVVGR